jgi:hypothetical protein
MEKDQDVSRELQKGVSIINPNPFRSGITSSSEENATFILIKDFEYISNYGSSNCNSKGICTDDYSPIYNVLKSGAKVTGRLVAGDSLIRPTFDYEQQMTSPKRGSYLVVKGYGSEGSISIPLDYLAEYDLSVKYDLSEGNAITKDENYNKNLLMIVGAFLLGYILFNKAKSE